MRWNYFLHLFLWAGPVILLQWAFGWRIFVANWRSVAMPALFGTVWFSLIDLPAIESGLWRFDENQILGIRFGPIPLEELLFFAVTSLLVAQSILLFLPASMRRPG
jgi:lycopene cyclase domain-containing protein